MQITKKQQIAQKTNTINVFYGLNHNPKIGSGELYQMENLTSDLFPLLCPRKARGIVVHAEQNITGMRWLDGLWYTAGTKLYKAESSGTMSYELGLSSERKSIISFGAYLIILPDKVYFNTSKPEDNGKIDKEYSVNPEIPITVSYHMCQQDGSLYRNGSTDPTEGATAPSNRADGMYWLDTSNILSNGTAVLKRWDADGGKWNTVEPTYLSISLPANTQLPFVEGDNVEIYGSDVEQIGALRGISKDSLLVTHVDGNEIVVQFSIGALSYRLEGTEDFHIRSFMPKMDYLFEHDNRLWGCRYGDDGFGNFVNEIYASALGDFRNWRKFQGTSTDSYSMSCGTDGRWTGAMEVGGYPTFWKERYLYKIYGDYPGQYSCDPVELNGVEDGGSESMAIINGVLYYKSRSGICRYDGSLPKVISGNFGNEPYGNGTGGACGNKYYACLSHGSGWTIMVYDTVKSLWHKENCSGTSFFCTGADDMYMVDAGAPKDIYSIMGNGTPAEESVSWEAETGILGDDNPEHSRINQVDFRLSCKMGVRVRVYAEYDSLGGWEPIGVIAGMGLGVMNLRLRPRRCDHMRLKIMGSGETNIHSMTIYYQRGSGRR